MNNRNLTCLAILAGTIYWVGDALFDKIFLSPNTSFADLLLYDSQTHEIYYRPTIILLIFVSTILYSVLLNKIKQRDSNLRQIINNINDAIFITNTLIGDNRNDKIIAVNECARKMLSYTDEDILQVPVEAIVESESLDDFSHLVEKFKTEGHVWFQTILLNKNGSRIPVEINAHIFRSGGKPVCLSIARDISARLKAERDFRELADRFRVLAERLIDVQEEERGRLSKELHDELGQTLMFLKMQVSSLQSRLPETLVQLRQECAKLLGRLNETAENVRRLSHDLNPRVLEQMGITLAVDTIINEYCELYGIELLEIDLDKIDNQLSMAAQLNLYRIIQESLTNIGKHAQATKISVQVKKQDNQIFIKIQDNGIGYESLRTSSERKGLGLSTINERARLLGGHLIIQSHEGWGTKMILTIPLRRMAQAGRRRWSNGSVSNFIG